MGKPRKNPVDDATIISTYRREGSAYAVARVLGIGETTVYRVLQREGVERGGLDRYRKEITRFQGEESAIKEAYEAGATYDQLRERFGDASDYALKHAIKRAGGTLRANPAPLLKPGELERIKELHASGMGQVGISLAIGRSQSFVSRVMRRNGIKTHLSKGSSHSMWKGGRMRVGEYWRVWLADDDPMASMRAGDGYVMEHRLVMARHLGRPLTRKETVHHINGDTEDNRVENLQLRHGAHGAHIVLCCRDCGSHNIGPAPLA